MPPGCITFQNQYASTWLAAQRCARCDRRSNPASWFLSQQDVVLTSVGSLATARPTMSQPLAAPPPLNPQDESVSATKGELLADSITKTNTLDRAAHIARDLESRLSAEAARARDAERALAASRETLAHQRAVLSTIRSQGLPALILQAVSATSLAAGGYALGNSLAHDLGWFLVAIGGVVVIASGWSQYAVSRKQDEDQ